MLLLHEEKARKEEGEESLAMSDPLEAAKTVELSLNSVVGLSTLDTMKLTGVIGGKW